MPASHSCIVVHWNVADDSRQAVSAPVRYPAALHLKHPAATSPISPHALVFRLVRRNARTHEIPIVEIQSAQPAYVSGVEFPAITALFGRHMPKCESARTWYSAISFCFASCACCDLTFLRPLVLQPEGWLGCTDTLHRTDG
mgnify:CR=1 FL=1